MRLSKYEHTRLKGVRMQQLAAGSVPFVVADYSTPSRIEDIFNEEARLGVLPFFVYSDSGAKRSLLKNCVDARGAMIRFPVRVEGGDGPVRLEQLYSSCDLCEAVSARTVSYRYEGDDPGDAIPYENLATAPLVWDVIQHASSRRVANIVISAHV